MAEPTAQRLRVTFTVTRADTSRFMLACDPLESASAPVIPGSDPPGLRGRIASRNNTGCNPRANEPLTLSTPPPEKERDRP